MTAIGKYNSSVNTNNTLFVVGNGVDTDNRKDAFVVKDNGDVLINPLNSSLLISLYDLIHRVSPHLIYTSNDSKTVSPSNTDALPKIISNIYNNSYGIMAFDTMCGSIGKHAFETCSNLFFIEIPNGVIFIDEFAFNGCRSLTSITIPNGVTSIGWNAFKGCGLSSVTIPASVKIIGDYAFYGCTYLKTITCNASEPPELQSSIVNNSKAFDDLASNYEIRVPSRSFVKYLNSPWGKYRITKQ